MNKSDEIADAISDHWLELLALPETMRRDRIAQLCQLVLGESRFHQFPGPRVVDNLGDEIRRGSRPGEPTILPDRPPEGPIG